MNIDKRLQEILEDYATKSYLHTEENEEEPNLPSFMAAIHFAFKDAGYVNQNEVLVLHKGKYYMDGPRWLERFMGNIPAGWILEEQIIEAARRASGVSDE